MYWSEGVSELISNLHEILSKCGSYETHSALHLRKLLADVTQRDLNSGAQHNTLELLGYILNHCPTDLFHFETSLEQKFVRERGKCISDSNHMKS